jgi:hypothetical protein
MQKSYQIRNCAEMDAWHIHREYLYENDALTVVNVKTTVSWDITNFSEGPGALWYELEEVAGISEILMPACQTACSHIRKDRNDNL